jgi:hypothetical protein
MNTPIPRPSLVLVTQLTHPFDLETFEERRARIIAKADELEWELRRRNSDPDLVSGTYPGMAWPAPPADEPTDPGLDGTTVRRRIRLVQTSRP